MISKPFLPQRTKKAAALQKILQSRCWLNNYLLFAIISEPVVEQIIDSAAKTSARA